MIILGIETSCDETSAAIIKNGKKILSNVTATSADMHAKTGGIIPEQAAREQIKSIIPVIETAIHDSQLTINEIDAIAVTYGPGLIGSLLVGVETAKTLSFVWNKPLVPVNHLVGHIYANWLETPDRAVQEPTLPAIALVVSGGHTDLVLLKNHGKLVWLGGTRDDAAGEAFDKTARLLKLPRPDGPSLASAAAMFNPSEKKLNIKLPRPMLDQNNYDFSFSGLKAAVLREYELLENKNEINDNSVNELAYEVQEAITDCLVEKTMRALKEHRMTTLLVAGGVAANSRLREKFNLQIANCKLQ
ncbi:MAG: tRNA (adenosine(37)-N6)-threonylcarbamoyltransferase complex transferase subunit TsaD, partial [Candidatus Blackburnbacteria bacterium RIFCSPLOWO2_02_FULL_44_9]